MKEKEFIVGLDIGTTKICAMIGKRDDDKIKIIGTGLTPSNGLRKGIIIDLKSTSDSIERVVEKAEAASGVEVTKIFTGIAGGHIKGLNSQGIIEISKSSREITKKDVERVIKSASTVAMPTDREVIHTIPREFIIDNQDGVDDPVGMSASQLKVRVYIITGAVASAQNIIKSINKAGFEVEDVVLGPLASGEAVLSAEEKRRGVLLVDMGGGTTDMIIFRGGAVCHSEVLAIGGNHVTNDIAVGLRIQFDKAEELKKAHGCALPSLLRRDEFFEHPHRGRLPSSLLCEIIGPRIEELLTIVKRESEGSSSYRSMSEEVVLTGGASLLMGLPEMAEQIFKLPVRIGVPNKKIMGLENIGDGPIYATAVGLLHYGLSSRRKEKAAKFGGRNLFSKVALRMKEWIDEYF
ncbi:cell division protein FtsA [candidate division NPL-UPA2 bacterium Unc8]|uniref:Cell division protein FtsA n=1 Tax=candidate division NPL-UPA2 bacterium Unc8 TaxID=1980939 RepID=A0A399FTZ1_UNCN2|nr:Cell division protein FtsA [Bacillota bacterium]MBT9137730.1 Cell division protein FtsA [Bacillota bacterium]RIH99754.1 MAG: cell division protein FtsA [candidate division NPL-UPA2 bacterium Unc8]